jgi:hypothetical protein
MANCRLSAVGGASTLMWLAEKLSSCQFTLRVAGLSTIVRCASESGASPLGDKVERYLQEYRLAETFVDVEYDLQIWRFKLANDGYSCLELWRLPLRIVGATRDRHSGLVPA